MLKVVATVDKSGTAIHRLATGLAKYHSNINYVVLDVHPKKPDREQLERFEKEMADADLWDAQYFRTAEMLQEKYEWLKDKKKILTHYNPYSIKESDWNNYDAVVGCNQSIFEELDQITMKPLFHIPITVDTDFWTYKREWTPNKNVLMVANRIEGKKGILPVAKVCKKLGLKFHLVGAISDLDYFNQILKEDIYFHQQISDEDLRKLYWESTLHVTNSVDNYESGTMPLLEAMLCGTPVLTRPTGHVPELYNKENMILNESAPEDEANLEKLIKEAFADTNKLDSMRSKAWDTAKTRSHERRAYMYQKLYRRVWSDQLPVSIITPIYDKPDVTLKCLQAIAAQDYVNKELIVCDDHPQGSRELVEEFAKLVDFPVRYIHKPSKGYGLAKQRNLGIIEATGDILVFCDQRMIMEPNAVTEFTKFLVPKHWVYGDKGYKKEFVENFSAVYREDLIKLGMFNERIDAYGGMSQEIRSRAKLNSFKIDLVPTAKATPIGASKNKHTHKQDIIRMKTLLWKVDLQL